MEDVLKNEHLIPESTEINKQEPEQLKIKTEIIKQPIIKNNTFSDKEPNDILKEPNDIFKEPCKLSSSFDVTKSLPLDYFLEWKNINYYIKDFNPERSNSITKDSNNNLVSSDSNENTENKITIESQNQVQEEDPYPNIDEETNERNRTIINNVSGFAAPREILVIMGPSGSGKTSLLNVIADRQLPTDTKKHVIRRNVTVNNIKVDKSYGMLFAYIMQDDVLLDTLTPRELLLFSARLKLKISYFKALKKVEDLINQVLYNLHNY